MTNSDHPYLKIHQESAPKAEVQSLPEAVLQIGEGLYQATGYRLSYVSDSSANPTSDPLWSAPVNPGGGTSPGYLMIGRDAESDSLTAARSQDKAESDRLAAAKQIAAGVVALLNERDEMTRALSHREAELAASVPVISREDDEQHFSQRLEAVLRSGAESVGCHAAGLYLLDAATTELKLRSCWGLPLSRLVDPARPLRGAIADLEALAGHAVVMEDDMLMDHWKVPEKFGSAVCVPVSTPTTELGTLWIYCHEPRDFTAQETNQVEIIAGRLATDLERELLLSASVDQQQISKQLQEAQQLQQGQIPSVKPLLEGWDIAGWTQQTEGLGGDFHDWFMTGENTLNVAVGDALHCGAAAALVAASTRSAIRAYAASLPAVDEIFSQTSQLLWSASSGDQYASLFLAQIDLSSGVVRHSNAGRLGALLLDKHGWQPLQEMSFPLGLQPEAKYAQSELQMLTGEVLVIFSDGVRDALDAKGRPLGNAEIAEALISRIDEPANILLEIVQEVFLSHSAGLQADDSTILVVRRNEL